MHFTFIILQLCFCLVFHFLFFFLLFYACVLIQEERFLLQLEEAIEALDAALEFKNRSIQVKQKKLLITDSSLSRSQSTEPALLCDVNRKLKELSTPEASELLIRYFNKVRC